MWCVPQKAVLVAASGRGPFELVAFDNALRKAGIADVNLIPVSSIWPKGCVLINELPNLEPGTLTPVVISKVCSSIPGQKIAAACAVATSADSYGMISEYHGMGVSERTAGKNAEAMVRYMMERHKLEPEKVTSLSAGHTVKTHGAALSAVVFLP